MAATFWLIRRRVRRRALALAPLALIVAAGGAGALVALGTGSRTATAYDRYVQRADVGDLQINPALPSAEIDAVIRSLPGVRAVTTHVLLSAGPEAASASVADIDNGDPAQVRGSDDGRYATMDRPALAAGRLPTGPAEAVIDVEMAKRRGLHIGDVVPMSFFPAATQAAIDDGEAPPDTPLTATGTERLTVVGIATLPDEVLPDGLYPRERMIVSPDIATRYDCTPRPMPQDGTYAEIVAAIFPDQCAISYRYYSLKIDGGDRGVAAALDAFAREGSALNANLPAALREHGIQYFLIPTTTATDRARIERSTQPVVTALVVLGVAAAVVTAAVAALAAARELRRSTEEQRQWWRLGMTTAERTRLVGAPSLVAIAVGLVAAVGLAWWLSPVGPIGNVRVVEPSPHRGVPAWSWWGLLALAAALVVSAVLLAFTSSRRAGRPRAARREVPWVGRIVRSSARPEVGEGVRAAFDGDRGAGVVVASGAIAAAVLVTSIVFGASLSALVSTPRSYGWPWEVGIMGGFGYGGLDLDAVESTLAQRSDVDGWTVLAFTNFVAVDGEPVPSVIGLGDASRLDLTLAAGRLPAGDGEVALGRDTAAAHGVHVGDHVELSGDGIETRQATVTGLTVMPALGPFESDRASPGSGMVLPAAMFDADTINAMASFVGVHVADGARPAAVLTALRTDYPAWHADSFTVDHLDPVRPAEIIDAQDMRSIPLLVGGLLAVTVVVGLCLVVVASVRARRRELGILRSLGFTGRQVGRSVRVQAAATMLAAVAIGAPLGIVVGRVTWRSFASRLAVVEPPATATLAIAVTVVGAVLAAVVVASIPAAMAARTRPTKILHSE